ncbi:MAG: TM0106 family RecB-like putative nuclease [Acidobacteria bacterium]|nr:TM0106 family RecB-like putative nuclease [Acidobacteriota bacterium]
MADLLRSDEILACVHRVALDRGQPFEFERPLTTPEMAKRQRDAENHRRRTFEEILSLHPDALQPRNVTDTMACLDTGAELVLRPHLAADQLGRRKATAHILVRVGRLEERFIYVPMIIKNNEVVEGASTRRLLEGSLLGLAPSEATFTDGFGPRSTPTVTRNGIALAHATRVLQALGHGDPSGRGAMIDRNRRVWWFDLVGNNYSRFNLDAYDALYRERLSVLEAHDQWRIEHGEFPTKPYWHRECLECPYSSYCERQLADIDDVSLTRFTNIEQQLLLHEHGINTRRDLARLDPHRARAARGRALIARGESQREDHLGRSIDKLDDLIYRARAHVRGTSLRILEPNLMGCPTADVEVDVDMESYDDATYLWGATVTVNNAVNGVEAGHWSFVNWGELNSATESQIFVDFWRWFDHLRSLCAAQDRSLAAYCFWAQAEDGAMNRAVLNPLAGGPTRSDLEAFRQSSPPQWIDLHELAKRQIQTEGPLGLKQLATASGFTWRDENPSGEASMVWYEIAAADESSEAMTSRQRILEYNEDDCRATKALRDWLNGPAKELAHRDAPA